MITVTAKQLHLQTKSVLDQLEKGQRLTITRNGRAVARLDPISAVEPAPWGEVMAEVWQAQQRIQPRQRVANPVLQERRRRRQ
jgi:antitoxin (DNA-binding transcriptional repressor) of toxin-antitoxin stability system